MKNNESSDGAEAKPKKLKKIVKRASKSDTPKKSVRKKSVKAKSVKKIIKKKSPRKTKPKIAKPHSKATLEKIVVPHVLHVSGVSEDQEAKFVLGPPQIADESWKDPAWDLPESYGDNRLVLIARDPQWVFCYWDIDAERREEGIRALGKNPGQARWNLRVYGVSPSSSGEKIIAGDVEIDFSSGKSYLELSPSGASFQVELGLMDDEGNFVPIAVSNLIDLPPDKPSESVDEQWMPGEWAHKEFYDSLPYGRLASGKSARGGSKLSFGVSSFSRYVRSNP